jgi:hypothetical protein
MINAQVVPLEFCRDPQSDVILIYGERECSVYFRCWASAGIPAEYIGHLCSRALRRSVAFLASFIRITLRRTVKGPTFSESKILT